MNRPDLTGLKADQLAYLEFLEGCVNGASNLIKELNLVSNTFASDLKLIRTGQDKIGGIEEGEFNYATVIITDKATDKTFERVMVLFDKIDKIKALASLTAPKEADKDKPAKTMQDFVIKPK